MKLFFIAVGFLIILLFAVYYFIGRYFYNIALNRKYSRETALKAGNLDTTKTSGSIYHLGKEWLLSHEKDQRTLSSNDGLLLNGFVIENQKNPEVWILIVHGYGSRGRYMAGFGKEFYDMGYSVLISDCRGHGSSEGEYIGMGWHDRMDVISWIHEILKMRPGAEIVLFGVSMGATAVLMASGERLPNNVKAVIADCGYSSVLGEFQNHLRTMLGFAPKGVLLVSDLITQKRAGFCFREASAIKQVKKSVTPTLFIHGEADKFVPFAMMQELYEAENGEKEKLAVPGANHATSVNVAPQLYWDTVRGFLKKHLQN